METYTIKVACKNCGYEGEEEKEKGEYILSWEEKVCPRCGCQDLHEYKNV